MNGIEQVRLAARPGLYAVYEVVDGDQLTIDVEPELSEEALQRYLAGQGRFGKKPVDTAPMMREIQRSWRGLRARAGVSSCG